MDSSQWSVLIVASGAGNGRTVRAQLAMVGTHPAVLHDSEAALTHPACEQANVFIVAVEARPLDGLEWVRRFRRMRDRKCHKAPVILLASHLRGSLVEACHDAGANAVIGTPYAPRTLIKTIKRVFAQTRPFVDSEGYVGPCRRVALVTAWPSSIDPHRYDRITISSSS
jgi:PleD family two-component response regulator